MGLRKVVVLYLTAKRQEGLSLKTLEQYGWHLKRMANWLIEHDIGQVRDVNRDLLREWGAGLRDDWSPATIKQGVSAARSFFSWCEGEGLCNPNPGLALKTPKVPARVQRTITLSEVRAMLSACDASIKGVRDRALVNLLIDTGLRASELCRVQLAEVNVKMRLLLVVVKGGSQDFAYFGGSTADALQAWIQVRLAAEGVTTLFVSVGGGTRGHPLTVRGLRIVIQRLAEKAGIDPVSPHAFRRGFACIATEAGAPSRVVQVAGRWGDIRMVERYTAALRRGELYRRWSPADFANGGLDP